MTRDASLLPSQELSVLHSASTAFTFYLCVLFWFFRVFFFLFSSDFFFSCDIHSPTGGFRIFLQLIQSFYFEMQLSLRKCISPISRVLTLFYKIIVFFLFIYFLLKRCAYLKAEPTLKDKEKLCIQAQGTVFCLSAR